MASATPPRHRTKLSRLAPKEQAGFDVTCVIGRITFGDGDMNPHEAAFRLIAQHDAPGTYSFPLATGGTCNVTVEYDNPHEDGERNEARDF